MVVTDPRKFIGAILRAPTDCAQSVTDSLIAAIEILVVSSKSIFIDYLSVPTFWGH